MKIKVLDRTYPVPLSETDSYQILDDIDKMIYDSNESHFIDKLVLPDWESLFGFVTALHKLHLVTENVSYPIKYQNMKVVVKGS